MSDASNVQAAAIAWHDAERRLVAAPTDQDAIAAAQAARAAFSRAQDDAEAPADRGARRALDTLRPTTGDSDLAALRTERPDDHYVGHFCGLCGCTKSGWADVPNMTADWCDDLTCMCHEDETPEL